MIQCKDCEFFQLAENGEVRFLCDPFSNIKEPECLVKWQILKINQMVSSYQATLQYYEKFAPMQEKMFRMMENEIDAIDEAEQWKQQYDHDEEDDAFDDSYEDEDDGESYSDPDAWKL